jgi:uncharacterized delta-60 repeat protein
MARQPDGRILIAGNFNRVDDQFRDRVARLEPDGSLDPSFTVRLGLNGVVHSLAIQPDGRIIAGGSFHVPRDDAPWIYNLIRLETNGAIDFSFAVGDQLRAVNTPAHYVKAVAVQRDGKVLAAGSFQRAAGSVRDYFARFNPDGTLDTTLRATYPFSPMHGAIEAMTLVGEDMIVLSSGTNYYRGDSLVRLFPQGHRDESFAVFDSTGPIRLLVPDDAGRLLLVASTTYSGRLMRLNERGSVDTNFAVHLANRIELDGGIAGMAVTDTGRIAVGGSFTSLPLDVGAVPPMRPARRIGVLHGGPLGPPVITRQPTNVLSDAGQQVLLSVGLIGTPPLRCQWLKDGGVMVGRTNTLLVFDPVTHRDAGDYQLIVTNVDGAATSGVVNVTLRDLIRPGAVELSFDPEVGTRSTVLALANGPANTLYISGNFTQFNTTPIIGPVRLTARGDVDPGFRTFLFGQTRWISPYYRGLGRRSDGVLLSATDRFAMFSPDGSPLYPNNEPYIYDFSLTVPNSGFYALITDSLGRILLGGDFRGVNGIAYNYRGMIRLTPDGILDPTFSTGLLGESVLVKAIALDRTGTILAGGYSYDPFAGGAPDLIRISSGGDRVGGFGLVVTNLARNGEIRAIVVDPEGRIVLGGSFDGGFSTSSSCPNCPLPRTNLGRLTSDGAIDLTFAPAGGANGPINAILRQADGRFVVGGEFTEIGGYSRNRLARLNPDGTVDPSFDVGAGPNGPIHALLLREDGLLAVGGNFSRFNGFLRGSVALVHLDAPSSPQFSGEVINIYVTAGQSFTLAPSVPGYPCPNTQWFRDGHFVGSSAAPVLTIESPRLGDGGTYSFIASNALGVITSVVAVVTVERQKLGAGSVDPTFHGKSTQGTDDDVQAMALQLDGRILIGGRFHTVNGISRMGLARLLPDGELDLSFNPGRGLEELPSVGKSINNILVESDGRILIAGSFNKFGGSSRPGLARINTDGTLAASLNLTSTVTRAALQPDGRILVGGQFAPLMRFFANGVQDTTFTAASRASPGAFAMIPRPDGKIVTAGVYRGNYLVNRLNPDGSLDTSFALDLGFVEYPAQSDRCFPPAQGAGTPPWAIAACVRADDSIVAGGVFDWASHRNLVRIESSGRFDRNFGDTSASLIGPDAAVRAVVLSPDGSLFIGGCFEKVDGVSTLHLARLGSDGRLDPHFTTAVGQPNDGWVATIVIQPDGRILIGGRFNQVNGQRRNNLARLNGDVWLFEPKHDGSVFSVRVATLEGRRYRLESRDTEEGSQWTTHSEFVGNGGILKLTTGAPIGTRRYFRVRAE